jgi:pilus assembly protein CpaB
MKASRFVVVGIAAVAALLLALVVRGMIGGSGSTDAVASQKVSAETPTVKVLVAARHLKVGERIAEADLAWKAWPQDGISEGYFTDKPVTPVAPVEAKSAEDKALEKNVQTGAAKVAEAADKALNPTRGMDAVLGGVVREEILANEPIVARKVVRADAGGFMAVMLAPGMRAMAVPVTVESTAGGFILPGDRVDIVVSTEMQSNGQTTHVAKPVLRNVKVLAVDQTVEAKSDQPSVIGATATLEVRPDEGEALAQAKAQGPLSLMLRSYADVGGPSGRAGPSAGNGNKVVVYRNGQGTDVPVTR